MTNLFWSWSGDFSMGFTPEFYTIPDRGPLKWQFGVSGSLTWLDFQATHSKSYLSHLVSPSTYSSQ